MRIIDHVARGICSPSWFVAAAAKRRSRPWRFLRMPFNCRRLSARSASSVVLPAVLRPGRLRRRPNSGPPVPQGFAVSWSGGREGLGRWQDVLAEPKERALHVPAQVGEVVLSRGVAVERDGDSLGGCKPCE